MTGASSLKCTTAMAMSTLRSVSMVAAALRESGRWEGSSVWSAPSLKPLNIEQVVAICSNHRAIITLEEHSVYGGLGAAIAEIASSYAPCWIGRIGVRDRFAQYRWLVPIFFRSEYGLDSAGISRQVDEFIERTATSVFAYPSLPEPGSWFPRPNEAVCHQAPVILVPSFNEEQNLPLVFPRLTQVLATLPAHIDYEVMVPHNASTDRTPMIAREFCERDARWKLLRYSRNFGVEASMMAGLDHASGDAVVVLFSDLQTRLN